MVKGVKHSKKKVHHQHINRLPDSVDIYAGEKLRLRRKELGLTQEKLAERLGISFQQLQKYEKGVNRIGIGRLFFICQALGVTPAYFFKEYEKKAVLLEKVADVQIPLGTDSSEQELLSLFRHIHDRKLKQQVLDLVKTLSEK